MDETAATPMTPNSLMRKRIRDGINSIHLNPQQDDGQRAQLGGTSQAQDGGSEPQTGDKRALPDDFDFDFSRSTSPPFGPFGAPPPPPLPLATFNYVAYAKAVAASKQRKAEHESELVAWAEARAPEREVLLFDTLLEVRKLLQIDRYENENWTMPKDVKDNIRQYTQAVILAPMLPTYSPDATSVMNLLIEKHIYPGAWTGFPSRLNAIRSYVQSCATNARADLKEAIKDSVKTGTYLTALCEKIVEGTELKVTAAFRHRVAWLRFLFANNRKESGNGFYIFADKQLVALRQDTGNNVNELAFAMTQYTTTDETTYIVGNDKPYTVWTDSDLPAFQTAANKAAKAIVPPVPK